MMRIFSQMERSAVDDFGLGGGVACLSTLLSNCVHNYGYGKLHDVSIVVKNGKAWQNYISPLNKVLAKKPETTKPMPLERSITLKYFHTHNDLFPLVYECRF